MDLDYQTYAQWIGGIGAAIGFLKVVHKRVLTPTQAFASRVGHTMDVVDQIDRRTLMTDARQSALVASQPDAMFEACTAGEFTQANRALEALTGFSRAHLTDMEWVNAIHPDDRVRVVSAWLRAVKDQRAWLENCRLLTSAGRTILVRIEAHPMRESIGERNVVGWLGIVSQEDLG